jgi:hypothetical protein
MTQLYRVMVIWALSNFGLCKHRVREVDGFEFRALENSARRPVSWKLRSGPLFAWWDATPSITYVYISLHLWRIKEKARKKREAYEKFWSKTSEDNLELLFLRNKYRCLFLYSYVSVNTVISGLIFTMQLEEMNGGREYAVNRSWITKRAGPPATGLEGRLTYSVINL